MKPYLTRDDFLSVEFVKVVIAAVLLLLPLTCSVKAAVVPGDVNGDHSVSVADAVYNYTPCD